MEINYPLKKLYKNNLFISIEESKTKPNVILCLNPIKLYSLLMFDYEAVGGNKIHWLIINIANNNILTSNTLIDYKGPAPPKGSGIHHYTFVLFEQKKYIEAKNIKFKSRFIELRELFKKIRVDVDNFKIKKVKSFISGYENKL